MEKNLQPILPATELYEWLLKNGIKRPILKGKQRSYQADWLPKNLEEQIAQLFSEGMWFPQEALGLTELLAGVHS